MAGGGPAMPEAGVLRALTTPVIGQFDPSFTAVMDHVMTMARETLLTANPRCFGVSATAAGGLESLINTLVNAGDQVAVGGGAEFAGMATDLARRYGANTIELRNLGPSTSLAVVPLVDPTHATLMPVQSIAAACHKVGCPLIVDATLGLGAIELRVDDWRIDACVAGADYGLGAPAGMALVTYSAALESRMSARGEPPRTSYLDLLQLQAYWSPERLNHHTAPTSLIYGLHEALRLALDEGLDARWRRHAAAGERLRGGLRDLGLDVSGHGPYAIIRFAATAPVTTWRERLRDNFEVLVKPVAPHTWRLGLLGADARLPAAERVLLAIREVLRD